METFSIGKIPSPGNLKNIEVDVDDDCHFVNHF